MKTLPSFLQTNNNPNNINSPIDETIVKNSDDDFNNNLNPITKVPPHILRGIIIIRYVLL